MHLTSVIFFVCYFLFIIAFFQSVSCICLSFMLFYFLSFTSNNWERKKNAMNAKKKHIQKHIHTLAAKRDLCAQRWNQMTGSKTRISSRHILSTVPVCFAHDFFGVWFLIVPNNKQTQQQQQIGLNWTVGYCSLFPVCFFVGTLLIIDSKRNMIENAIWTKIMNLSNGKFPFEKGSTNVTTPKRQKKSVDKLTTVQQRFTSNSILFHKHLISPSVERPSPSIIIIGLFL